ncbi:MAG: hypothetical protein U0L22_08180 [Bacteroidales bacterium]|nr:hypothetical protein [Bacteroidales bacterium]
MIGTSNKIITYLLEQAKDKQFELKEYKEKRSLNANNYYWNLVTELGNVLKMDKENLHFLLLQKYGQSEMISVVADVDMKNYLKYYTEAGESNLNGKTFKHYKVYKGSSEMDSKEMSILINGLVEECHIQGIETKTPAEINSLLERWDNK